MPMTTLEKYTTLADVIHCYVGVAHFAQAEAAIRHLIRALRVASRNVASTGLCGDTLERHSASMAEGFLAATAEHEEAADA